MSCIRKRINNKTPTKIKDPVVYMKSDDFDVEEESSESVRNEDTIGEWESSSDDECDGISGIVKCVILLEMRWNILRQQLVMDYYLDQRNTLTVVQVILCQESLVASRNC